MRKYLIISEWQFKIFTMFILFISDYFKKKIPNLKSGILLITGIHTVKNTILQFRHLEHSF